MEPQRLREDPGARGGQLDSLTYDALNQRKNSEFQKFLDTTNSKGAIFRDIIIESEYDPLEPNRNCIKVPTRDIRDPCRRVLDKALDERVDLPRHELERMRRAKQREILHVEEWATGKIEATPHGFFAKMMKEKTAKTAGTGGAETTNSTFKSEIPFDHYNVLKARRSWTASSWASARGHGLMRLVCGAWRFRLCAVSPAFFCAFCEQREQQKHAPFPAK